jgi:hypothetical protein
MRLVALVLALAPAVAGAADFTPFKATLDNSTAVYKGPDLLKSKREDCVPDAGSHARVVEQQMMPGTPQSVSKIEVYEGNCRGLSGWLLTSHLTRLADQTPTP